jgi:hypothetical protein
MAAATSLLGAAAGLGDPHAIAHAISYFHAIQQAPTDGKGTVLVALTRRSQRSTCGSVWLALVAKSGSQAVPGPVPIVVESPEADNAARCMNT